VEIVRGDRRIEIDAISENVMRKIKESFGDRAWKLVGPRSQVRTALPLRDGCTYAALLPEEAEVPQLPEKSKFTRQTGRPMVHFKVDLRGHSHELSIKEGDNRNLTDALYSISGAEKVSIPQGKVALDWEGKTFKGRESGAECRIPFYLKLQTGEKDFGRSRRT
jgi:hypothetical protein